MGVSQNRDILVTVGAYEMDRMLLFNRAQESHSCLGCEKTTMQGKEVYYF